MKYSLELVVGMKLYAPIVVILIVFTYPPQLTSASPPLKT
jgi:hypothetical protein